MSTAILLEHMHKKLEITRTKIKGGCQSGRKVVTHNSKSDFPLVKQAQHEMFQEWKINDFVPLDCLLSTPLANGSFVNTHKLPSPNDHRKYLCIYVRIVEEKISNTHRFQLFRTHSKQNNNVEISNPFSPNQCFVNLST